MGVRQVAVAVLCSGLACGGALQRDEGAGDGGSKTTMSAPLPANTPYGTWDLVALDGMSGGNASTGTSDLLALELRDDGNAIARRCTRPYFDSGFGIFRCADANAYECHYGTIVKEARAYRIDIPGLRSPALPGRGEIATDGRDAVTIQYVLPKYSAGHFTRVTGSSPTSACANP